MRLRHATTAQDEASEAIATAFVKGEPSPSSHPPSAPISTTASPLPVLGESHATYTTTGTAMGLGGASAVAAGREVDVFVKEFKDARKKYHKRAMWVERWSSGQVAWRED